MEVAMVNKTPWTPAQEAMLREEYADRSLVDLAAKIGFGVEKVRRKASALGLRRNSDFVTKLRLRERSLKRQEFFQTMLPANAEPIASSDQERFWSKARESNPRFLELLTDEFLASG